MSCIVTSRSARASAQSLVAFETLHRPICLNNSGEGFRVARSCHRPLSCRVRRAKGAEDTAARVANVDGHQRPVRTRGSRGIANIFDATVGEFVGLGAVGFWSAVKVGIFAHVVSTCNSFGSAQTIRLTLLRRRVVSAPPLSEKGALSSGVWILLSRTLPASSSRGPAAASCRPCRPQRVPGRTRCRQCRIDRVAFSPSVGLPTDARLACEPIP